MLSLVFVLCFIHNVVGTSYPRPHKAGPPDRPSSCHVICNPGESGLPGLPGDEGFPGPPGPKGPPGDVLFQNANEDGQTQLLSELKGEHGAHGFKGLHGRGGMKGAPGFRGRKGLNGICTVTGGSPCEGDRGRPGLPGEPGWPGLPGLLGLHGDPGRSENLRVQLVDSADELTNELPRKTLAFVQDTKQLFFHTVADGWKRLVSP